MIEADIVEIQEGREDNVLGRFELASLPDGGERVVLYFDDPPRSESFVVRECHQAPEARILVERLVEDPGLVSDN